MIFPLASAALIVVLDGAVVRSYNRPEVRNGRVFAPVEPYLTSVARTIGFSGGRLIVSRGDRFAQVQLGTVAAPQQWENIYVEIAPVLRSLGARVSYDPANDTLNAVFPPAVVASPTPFNPAVPLAPPGMIFTPAPIPTTPPAVTGKPTPRRTPLPCCL